MQLPRTITEDFSILSYNYITLKLNRMLQNTDPTSLETCQIEKRKYHVIPTKLDDIFSVKYLTLFKVTLLTQVKFPTYKGFPFCLSGICEAAA